MPDLTSCILFSSVFLKKARAILCQTNLDLIWMAWPGFSNTDLVWKQAGVQESSGLVSDRRQPLCSSTDVPHNVIQNQAEADLVLADCARFWPNRSSPEVSQCARIIQPASGQYFLTDPAWMRIGSGMFTGTAHILFRENINRWAVSFGSKLLSNVSAALCTSSPALPAFQCDEGCPQTSQLTSCHHRNWTWLLLYTAWTPLWIEYRKQMSQVQQIQ